MKTTKNYSDVQKLVFKMLVECTGTHFLDSGFANGRHWQKNQKKTIHDFNSEDEETYIFDKTNGYMERSVSVFHFLSGLELDEICDKFNRRNTNAKDWEGEYYGMSKRAWNWLNENYDVEFTREVNTYNYECDLSQTLQWTEFDIWVDGCREHYYSMQIHNGADVRGGYTDAKLFRTRFHSDGIHEYLQDYKHKSEIKEDLEFDYLTVYDYADYGKENTIIPCAEVLEIMEAK